MDEQAKDFDITTDAANWSARLDRGLTPQEQDEYLQWLQRDPRHRQAIARLNRTWTALDTLALWQPSDDPQPNPDLLAPARERSRRRRFALMAAVLVGAGALAVSTLGLRQPRPAAELAGEITQSMRIIPGPERRTLDDQSILEAREASQYELAFTPKERRVLLLQGEFHVQVTPDPARPFVVETEGVTVRAIGTAFAVRRNGASVNVLVTEGKVQVETTSDRVDPVPVTEGERAEVSLYDGARRATVSSVTVQEIERALAWQGSKLEFDAVPLAAVIAEFNLRNKQQLVLGDRDAGQVRVAGTFRADNVGAFTRLLEASFGIQVERPDAGPWILRSAR